MANKTIDEIKAEAAVVRDATEEGENTAMRVGTVMIDMIDTLSESVSINAIKGYVVIDNTSELPEEPTPEQQQKGYLLDTTLYVYVGEGGDTLDGKYQSAELKGADGAPGPQGPKGDSGVDLGEVVLVDDLTTGGRGSALSAEMGKVLGQRTEYPMEKVQPSESGTIKDTNGSDWAIGGYWRTPYTIIDPTKPVYAVGDSNNNSVAFVAFYNNKKQFISCVKKLGAAGVEYEIQVPEGATLARSTCTTAQKPNAYLTQKVQQNLVDVVSQNKVELEGEINLLDGATLYLGYLVNGVVTGATFSTSDYIRIDDTMKLILEVVGSQYNSGIDVLAFYTDRDDSTYLGGITTSSSGNFAYKDILNIPSGAKWVRVCGPYVRTRISLMCAKNEFNDVVLESIIKTPSVIAPLQTAKFLLPSFIDVVVGRQCDFFVGDTIDNPSSLPFRYTYGDDITDLGKGHLRITGASVGTTDLVLTTKISADAKTFLYNDGSVGSQTIKVRKVAKSGGSGTFNVLIVGDSLVEYGSAANPVETYKLLAEDGDVVINQIGTQTQVVGGVTYRHEGHGGWTWARFNSGSDSPFVFNGQLSFAQYMATNFPTLTGIDLCVVMLGTNDTESVVLSGAKTFVDALLADYPNCKIAIGIPAYGRPCEGMPTAMERKIRYEAYVYLDTFDNGKYHANVTCIGQGCWIDRVNDYQHEEADSTPYSEDKFIRYTDGVHPRAQGYKQWGRAVYCKIRSWIAGNL